MEHTRRKMHVTALSERKGNSFKDFDDFYLKAKARIWPELAYVFHVRSAAAIAIHKYLAYKKQPPPQGPPQGPRRKPAVGS